MVHELPCYALSATEHRSEPGWTHSTPEPPRTSLWSPWLTSLPALPGLFCPAATNTDPLRRKGAEKAPVAWKRYDGLKFPPKAAQEQQG
ncbi:MAG: hypothetical protein QOE55_8187 [Acidobacteriaceae bacterium]|nr:hypothetical protein [Acidobacteriaceae bacterium]